MTASPHYSFWLQDIAGDAPTTAPLEGNHETDVVVVGGGYVGLWTAFNIKKLNPRISVIVLEKSICGGGASGRNGGFALSYWPKLSSLVAICGRQEAVRVCRDSEKAILEIEETMTHYGIDIEFRRSPWLWTATSSAQIGSWSGVVDLCRRLGIEDVFLPVESSELARRTGSKAHRAGVVDNTAATLHPAKVARGLRRICLGLGVKIYENTEMTSFTRAEPLVVRTSGGAIRARRLIIATNAWAAGIRELARSIVPITSDMIVTAPAPEVLKGLGWAGGECITDSQMMVDYYHVTREGRLAFGKGGWGIAYGGNLTKDFDRNQTRATVVAADLHRYYPQLRSVPVTHDWCGPIDRTPNSLPLLGRFKDAPHIIYGVGWSGNGVGPSVLGGKILASMALDLNNEWSNYPLCEKSVGKFPPEPIRYIGAHVVRTAVAAKERAEIEDKQPSWLSVQISKLAPAGLEDKTKPEDN